MAASGRPVEITFTPDRAGVLKVTVSFNASGTGSDWGSGHAAACFCEQSSSTSYGLTTSLADARQAYTLVAAFDVSAGAEVKCGLYGSVTGAATLSFYTVNAVAEFSPI